VAGWLPFPVRRGNSNADDEEWAEIVRSKCKQADATGLGPASDAVDPLGAAGAVCDEQSAYPLWIKREGQTMNYLLSILIVGVVASQTMIWHSLATIRDAIRRRRMSR
jgi:hypothetical protein